MSGRRNRAARSSADLDLELVGGGVALNFINTLRADAGEPLETLQSDIDVRAWMTKNGLRVSTHRAASQNGALLDSARHLRRIAQLAIAQKKAGKRVQLSDLNAYLAGASSHLLLHQSNGIIQMHRQYDADSAQQALAPIAEAIADLLANARFDQVRQCEASGCVLWFTDSAGGRPRRFCAEETCGPRTRVAAFRARQAERNAAQR